MQRYRIDFAMSRGHEMIVDRERGINKHDLQDIELQMLQSQRIPYLLPVDWFELDGNVTFRYKLDGAKMLLHRLQQQTLTMDQYYSLILGVTDALSECKHYMLRPESCLLDEQFIFIGEQLHDVRLAYVPMICREDEKAIGVNDLLSLIVRFTSYVEHIDGEGLKRILQHLNDRKWPLSELRVLLLELISGNDAKSGKEMQPFNDTALHWPETLHNEQESAFLQDAPPAETENQSKERPYAIYEDAPSAPYEFEEKAIANAIRIKKLLTALLIAAAACAWRFIYFTMLTRQSMLISAGVTLLLAAGLLFIWRKKALQQEPLDDNDDDEVEEANLIAAGAFGEYKVPDDGQAAVHSYFTSPTSMPVTEPTVLLRHADDYHAGSQMQIYLQRSWEGEHSRIDLSEDCFKIGRKGELVSYAEKAAGVSRLHLEIEHADGEHRAKDLGSSNGSLLNGQAMIAYKSYKLSPGDIIHLAGVKGPSYELKSG